MFISPVSAVVLAERERKRKRERERVKKLLSLLSHSSDVEEAEGRVTLQLFISIRCLSSYLVV